MQYEPFDIEIALKFPDKVRTRNGDKIADIHLFKVNNIYPVGVFFEGEDSIYSYQKDGRFDIDELSKLDLFLLPDYKEMYVNVWLSASKSLYLGKMYETLEIAKENSIDLHGIGSTYLKTIKITSLPYEPNTNQKEAL